MSSPIRFLDPEGPPYVIAECGHNHGGSLDTAKAMFREAKLAGADAVKLQKRDNRSLYTQAAYDAPYNSENAFGATYGEHREALELGRAEYACLQAYSNTLGLDFFATAFDVSSADFLLALDMPAYKIASGDLTNTPLLRYVAGFGKPVIISTGGATIEDVQRAYETIMPVNSQLAILQCTASYPAGYDQLDLRVIETYRTRFPRAVIGFSDHSNGISAAVAAYALGARIIEKHFTLNRASKGTDHAFSLEPVGLRKMCRDLKRMHEALGTRFKRVYDSERGPIAKMSKSLVAAYDLPAGHVVRPQDVAMKSPGGGLPPYELCRVVGRVLFADMEKDERFS